MSQNVKQVINGLELVKDILKLTLRANYHKKTMTNIILENINNEEKVQKLDESILKYNEDMPEKEEIKNIEKIFFKQIAITSKFFNDLMIPLKQHEELVENIANIIKWKDLTAAKKVDVILNLLS